MIYFPALLKFVFLSKIKQLSHSDYSPKVSQVDFTGSEPIRNKLSILIE